MNFTKPEKWAGLDGTGGMQCQLSDHTEYSNSQLMTAVLCLKYPETRELVSLCLQMYFSFLMGLSDFIMHWYCQIDGTKVYDEAGYCNIVCKLVHTCFEDIHLVKSVAKD